MGTQGQNDDFEERAAIREFDALYPREKAEQLAAADVLDRKDQQEIYERLKVKKSIESLRERREVVGQKMRAETDPEKKDELFREWSDFNSQILSIRKGS